MNRYLLWLLVKNDIYDKYRGSIIGLLWTLINPIIMLVIYTIIFSDIFRAKWGTDVDSKSSFAMALFCGLIIYNIFAEVAQRSTYIIQSNVNYVKKVVFPLEYLADTVVYSALFNGFMSLIVLMIAHIAIDHVLSWNWILLPFILLPFVFFLKGIALLISALCIFFKDLKNVMGIIVTIMLYVSPVFFTLEALPAYFRSVCYFNPLTYCIEIFRNVVLYNKGINALYYVVFIICSCVFYLVGKFAFGRLKKGFADAM